MTTIGTPLSPSATRVMFLGSGELGKEVVIELQRFGCEVIAVDRYPNAPAMQVAHRSHVIPMTDPQVLNGLIMAEAPHIIVPQARPLTLVIMHPAAVPSGPLVLSAQFAIPGARTWALSLGIAALVLLLLGIGFLVWALRRPRAAGRHAVVAEEPVAEVVVEEPVAEIVVEEPVSGDEPAP